MALLNQPIELNSIPITEKSYGLIPAGWYTATISKSELRMTKAGTGEMIACMFTISGPTHQGRTCWTNINIRNQNPKAEEVGREQLGYLMRATGLSQVVDTDVLIGKTCQIKIAVRDDERYGEGNEIKGFRAAEGGSMPQGGGLPMPALASAPTPAKAAPPWAKK